MVPRFCFLSLKLRDGTKAINPINEKVPLPYFSVTESVPVVQRID
jgi:hypothetical protein